MNKTESTGVSLSAARMAKLNALALALGVSRNETVGLLVEVAQVVSRPAVNVVFTEQDSNGALQEKGQNGQ
jgi:hypothetical protein